VQVFFIPNYFNQNPNIEEFWSSLVGQSGAGKDMSGMIGANADFSDVSFKDAQISKSFSRNSKFVNCDFTNAVVDRS